MTFTYLSFMSNFKMPTATHYSLSFIVMFTYSFHKYDGSMLILARRRKIYNDNETI